MNMDFWVNENVVTLKYYFEIISKVPAKTVHVTILQVCQQVFLNSVFHLSIIQNNTDRFGSYFEL